MNSVEVQPLSLYRNGVRWRTQNTTPCWRKEITVGAILDQQMRGDRSLLLECWVRHCWALSKGEGTRGKEEEEKKTKKT